ncbi:YcaO-like family protein [Pyrobaculum aerophilum]|uniref:YcaO-like family protein n=1 Tax=Pyrobaculum aerophilum TaxID=13773 RepID=UPI0015F2677C|nr:YcaO-like family protein [Pyrobaculum aerophilum]
MLYEYLNYIGFDIKKLDIICYILPTDISIPIALVILRRKDLPVGHGLGSAAALNLKQAIREALREALQSAAAAHYIYAAAESVELNEIKSLQHVVSSMSNAAINEVLNIINSTQLI